MYRLKPGQEAFDVVDGPAAGLKFLRGKAYDGKTIPKTEAWRFEPVPQPAQGPRGTTDLPAEPAKPAGKPAAKKEK
jgi:hypothetical protein